MPRGQLTFIASIRRAIYRSRIEIILMGLVYVIAVLTGALMVHKSSKFALDYRDKIVNRAHKSNPATIAFNKGQRLESNFH
jgi:hypothetical protein